MEQSIVNKELGSEGSLQLDLKAGKLVLEVKYDGAGVDGSIKVEVSADYFLDKLKEKIPGQVDDTIIEILKAALKA